MPPLLQVRTTERKRFRKRNTEQKNLTPFRAMLTAAKTNPLTTEAACACDADKPSGTPRKQGLACFVRLSTVLPGADVGGGASWTCRTNGERRKGDCLGREPGSIHGGRASAARPESQGTAGGRLDEKKESEGRKEAALITQSAPGASWGVLPLVAQW